MKDIQTGDIIFVRGNTPIISPLIRWFTGSEYTHIGVAIGQDLICEIDFNSDLAIRPIGRHEDYDVYRMMYGLSSSEKEDIRELMIEAAITNKGYDWLRIINFVIKKFLPFPFILDKLNKVICSEIIDVLYMGIGIDLLPYKKTGDVSPGDLVKSPFLEKITQ